MRGRIIIAFALFVVSSAIYGQDITDARLASEVSNAQASPVVASGAGNTPTNRDYLSLIIAALESYSESGGEAITFDYNFPQSIFGSGLATKAQLVLRQPVLNEKLADTLSEHSATLKTLESELSYGDDITFTLSVSPQAKKTQANIRHAFRAAAIPLMLDAAQARRATRLNTPMAAPSTTNNARQRESAGVAVLNEALRDGTERAEFAEAAAEDAALLTVSQSKFIFDGSYRRRRETVGPNDFSIKASYEHGFASNVVRRLGGRLDACAQQYLRASLEDDTCASRVAEALLRASQAPSVQQGRRLTFALEYHSLSAIDIGRTDPTVTFSTDSSRSIVWSFAAGRDVFTQKALDARGRIEFSLAYDDVSGDKNRRDRMIGKLTYSQRITEKLHIPISLIYANHSDYLTSIDRKLNAHFGLAYKIPKLPKG